jgi:hypothetical protein
VRGPARGVPSSRRQIGKQVTDGKVARAKRNNAGVRFWHRHKWGEWERAWGKGSAKGYVLERKCVICDKTQAQVIR